MTYPQALKDHLATGTTTIARCFAVTRTDGAVLGFTDHDRDLMFDGVTFRAETGLTARALQTGTGLAVDNSEAVGALSSDAVSEEDILAGRYDGAEVRCWQVNWQDVTVRALEFRGSMGEIGRTGGAFSAELRGLTEKLNRPRGRMYQSRCTAVLGDDNCGFDLGQPGFAEERVVEWIEAGRVFVFSAFSGLPDRFFEKGRLHVLTGRAAGLAGVVKNDRLDADGRRAVELWQGLGLAPEAGDLVRVEAGCDKRADTCKLKFANLLNFQGFPTIPGEDWLMAFPSRGGLNDGGSMIG